MPKYIPGYELECFKLLGLNKNLNDYSRNLFLRAHWIIKIKLYLVIIFFYWCYDICIGPTPYIYTKRFFKQKKWGSV